MSDSEPGLDQQTVCIVGLGLMGGSLALALASKVQAVRCVDSRFETRKAAQAQGLLQFATDALEEGIAGADTVILAAPVRTNVQLIKQLAAQLQPGTLLMDLSSTKREIVAAMDQLPLHVLAVGGHPMCGKDRAGFSSAEAALFESRAFALCPSTRTTESAMSRAIAIVTAVGAYPVPMDAGYHDAAVARVSHLPYLLSATLVASVQGLPQPTMSLAASGYRDASRLAGCDPEMMVDVLLTNAAPISDAIEAAQAQLERFAQLIRRKDHRGLHQLCTELQTTRRQWEHEQEQRAASRGRSADG